MDTLLIGSDHAGFELKRFLKEKLEQAGVRVADVGCNDETSCDYPEFAQNLCRRILHGEAFRGIAICGTGLGMTIAANRFAGIRAALCTTEYHARMSRAHNDTNVLCLGGRVTGTELAWEIVKVWLETPFEGGRHKRRIDLIDQDKPEEP
jgi:ribose 5-phosphate isomerase B